MNTTSDTLTIHPNILALADVSASEKMLLAVYTANPEAKDFEALNLLSVGLSGLKKIKKRLFEKKLLKRTASAHRVLLPGGGHFVLQSRAVEKVEKVTRRPAADVADELADLFDSFEKSKSDRSTGGMRARTLAFWSAQLTTLLAEAREVFPPDCADLLATAERYRNYWATCCYAAEVVKGQREFNDLARRLGRATNEQLADFYERIQSERQLGPGR